MKTNGITSQNDLIAYGRCSRTVSQATTALSPVITIISTLATVSGAHAHGGEVIRDGCSVGVLADLS